MFAGEVFFAGSVTSRPVTHLMAHLETLVMATYPRTRLATWYTLFSTLFRTFTVYATVFAGF